MRKSVCFLVCTALFVGCAPGISYVAGNKSVGAIDFIRYSEKDFLFSPHEYLGDYESVGLVSASIFPAALLEKIDTGKKNDAGEPIFKKVWDIKKVNLNEALDSLYYFASKLNANAIIDLRIETKSEIYNKIGSGVAAPEVTITGYEINGFAIKRLGAFKHQKVSDSTTNAQ